MLFLLVRMRWHAGAQLQAHSAAAEAMRQGLQRSVLVLKAAIPGTLQPCLRGRSGLLLLSCVWLGASTGVSAWRGRRCMQHLL